MQRSGKSLLDVQETTKTAQHHWRVCLVYDGVREQAICPQKAKAGRNQPKKECVCCIRFKSTWNIMV